jgi:phosphinothricin acetyltransferase
MLARAMSDSVIRPASEADHPAITEIYNHYIATSPATFDLEPYTLEARQPWFDAIAASDRYQLVVAVGPEDGAVRGYAASLRFRVKAAYDPTIETTIYLAPEAAGQGLGRRLYAALFETLAGRDIHLAVAAITLPNPVSIALHEAFGFERLGVFRDVGRKLGRYWDVAWYQKLL